ncbi:uncharacterized protein LOC102806620 [Saccoglossus kowalevskii]|uniref:Uncharacterized protein LOC102806620 n=1 Tax=Saccoglossus kowalevskii TaxID=10224 RepID=A0ABM0M340_SACKO|nr:PREDICTED: uncharacterized protein LOC102806620 [Saccoglossus kowalevskii]
MEKGVESSSGATRVMLWTYPRTRSLSVEFAMATQPNIAVHHELYYTAYLFGGNVDDDENDSDMGFTFNEVKKRLEVVDEGKSVVFAKDMAYSLEGNFHNLPKGFRHSFLIRNPEKSIASLYNVFCETESRRPEDRAVQMSGVGELYELYMLVKTKQKSTPLIIDSDDLIRFPGQILRKYCDKVGIKYNDTMLSWKRGKQKVAHWPEPLKDAAFMYEDAVNSSGFDYNLSSLGTLDTSKLPQSVITCMESCKPLYLDMWENRIKPDTVETDI